MGERMLVGVVALAAWELTRRPRTGASFRRVAALAWPFAAYGLWIGLVYVRLGALPYGTWSSLGPASAARLGTPGVGLADALRHGINPTGVSRARRPPRWSRSWPSPSLGTTH